MRGQATTVEYQGQRVTCAQLSALCGIPARSLYSRIFIHGWGVDRAASATLRKSRGGRPAVNVPRACPKMKRHPSGRAYSRWKMKGETHERYFGQHGTPDAAVQYRRFAQDWATGKYDSADIRGETPADGVSVASLVARWLTHVRAYYVKDGKQTSEVAVCEAAAQLLLETHGDTLAIDFDPAALRAYRKKFVDRKLSRGTINSYVSRIVRVFAWGAGQSLLPPTVHGALKLVESLKPGRTTAPDRERKKPVTDAQVEATIPHLAPSEPARAAKHADMIRIQRLAGMRPGEVCAMSRDDIDTAADVWRYEVGKANKNRHRGKRQAYFLGPRAVAILRPYLEAAPARGSIFGERSAVYSKSVHRASVRSGAGAWSPHQLRHALATAVAAKFRTLEHAAAAIGDTEAVASAVYVHVDPKERAKIEVARAMG